MRIGHGYDVHRLIPGEGLMIGGVMVPCDYSFEAHSDGDVLLHALCDALLGAAALGDIGRHFPDTDARWKGADSRGFLRHVRELLLEKSLRPANLDATVIAQKPKLAGFIPEMCARISGDLQMDPDRVNVKATTTEKLGFAGRAEGIAAHAVVLLESAD